MAVLEFDREEGEVLVAFALENITTGLSILLNVGYKMPFPEDEMMLLRHDMKKYAARLQTIAELKGIAEERPLEPHKVEQ